MPTPDLNLLSIFDLLFEERSVSSTARRLNLTQSAVSHALTRLRAMIGDPLFVRGAGSLHPTARAEELAPQLREILIRVRAALNPPAFDPHASRREFTIAAGSYFCRLVVPQLVARARRDAPEVVLRLVNVDQALLDGLDQGTIDIAIGAFDQIPARLHSQPLFQDTTVWVSSRRHRLAGTQPDGMTLAAQPQLRIVTDHALRPLRNPAAREQLRRRVLLGESERPPFDGVPAARERETGLPMQVYDAETAAAVVGCTDLLAILPRRLAAARAEDAGLHLFDRPTGDPGIELTMLWHSRFADDAGLAWLRNLIIAASPPFEGERAEDAAG